jgi:hypothetical protein
MSEKFVGYFRLLDACGEPGCPVCRCLAAESRRYLEALLDEQVTDPDTRGAIRRSWGFCNWHTWMLPEIGGSAFGAAIIYEDLVTRVLHRTHVRRRARARGWLTSIRRPRPALLELRTRRAECPACADASATEARYLDAMVRFAGDEALRDAYAGSDGLCLPHVLLAVERSGERAGPLVARTREAWARIGADLAGFVGKHDHRNREPYTAAEAAACARAFQMLAGARGVFGHSRGTTPIPPR